MSMSVQPKPFLDALNHLLNVVERRTTMPIVSHVLLSAGGGRLTLRGTDLDIEIETSLDCEGELEPICAPADRLQSTVARLAERGAASISLDGQTLTLVSGRARFTMPALLPEGFPSLSNADVGCSFTIEGKTLAALFGSCGFAMANSTDRRYLNGVLMFSGTIGENKGKAKASKLCGVATDGLKLSAREVPADLPGGMPEVIVPRKAVLALGKMVEGWDAVAVEISDTRMIASFGPTRFITKLVEEPYPDWRRVCPGVEAFISYDVEQLTTAVATAHSAVQAEKSARGIKIVFGAEETECTTRSADGATAGTDACPHSLLGDPPAPEIGLNPKYLLEALAGLKAETVEIGFVDTGSPVLITAPALPDRKAIVMPMRV